MRPRAHNKYFVELTEHFQLSWRAGIGTNRHTRNEMNRFMLMLPSANITVHIIPVLALHARALMMYTHIRANRHTRKHTDVLNWRCYLCAKLSCGRDADALTFTRQQRRTIIMHIANIALGAMERTTKKRRCIAHHMTVNYAHCPTHPTHIYMCECMCKNNGHFMNCY